MSKDAAQVVKLTWLDGGVAVVALEDRAARNFFSEALSDGIVAAFEAIRANAEARAVVVHGYDNYFSCGGMRDQLVAISQGRMLYTDFKFFDQLRRCEVPTIAAMQGHALGGGLAFGLLADMQVLGEECIYSSNFMEYGFTPGMCSTFTVPRAFGEVLGWEMLYTGANYRGMELRQRGAQVLVRPRSEVIPCAIERAKNLAAKPVESLRELKRRWIEITQPEFELAVRRELEMHKVTFALPVVQERIRTLFQE